MQKIIFIVIFFIFFLLVIFFISQIYLPKSLSPVLPKEFSIKKGEGIREIALNLEKEGLIKNRYFFNFYVFLKGKSKKLQAGRYLISPAENIPEIVKKIASGEVIKKKITIIEGWNLRDIGRSFENQGMFMAEELFELAGFPLVDYSKATDMPFPKDFSQEFNFLEDKPKNVGLEGYFFPDTYEISVQADIEEIVKKMLVNFDKKLTPDLREKIQTQNKSIFEIITMASLIEKEVYNTQECKNCKELVSGILWKRLKSKIPLQVDATITYITGKKTTKISKEETEIDSPYNTYKYLGLPLGPICNPGLESILAALYPEDSEFWYYLSLPDGKTEFSKTLEEHNFKKAQ